MSMSFMAHQRDIDRASDIELDMERIEQDMREILLSGDEFPITYRNQSGIRCHAAYNRDDVVNAMIELDDNAFNSAVMMTGSDPIEAAKILCSLKARAVEQIIGLAPIREAAEFTEQEQAA
ncbi:MAG: hypothetical protein ACPHQ9_13005 [Marinobacter sp.]|uniref:hypothetical protein n=1 Tax=Marinobacter sp. TaxID=50741 RepID=UPI003C64EB80